MANKSSQTGENRRGYREVAADGAVVSEDGGKKKKKQRTRKRESFKERFARSMPESKNPVGVARRSVWFILRSIIIVSLIIALCYAVFVEALYVSNIYIIVTEGMAMRADCILTDGAVQELTDHFDKNWLLSDGSLYDAKYDGYYVESYDYRISIESMKVFPWSSTARVGIVERIPSIQASAYNEGSQQPVPEWDNARYELLLEKVEGRWIITNITLVELNPEPEPANTPDYSQLETNTP